jgi:5-methylcytosine-specific restriction endonuclease McrA
MNKTEKKFKENLSKILDMIKNEEPKVNICRFLGIKHSTLNNYFKKYNIFYLGNQSRKGIPHSEQIIHYTEYTEKGKNISASALRIKLIKQGVKDKKCEICGLDYWMNKPIPLELHHIDENRFNNKLENLQILCSNCHMQVHNYSNTTKLHKKTKVKITSKNYCNCGNEIKTTSKECIKCSKEKQRKCERPTYEKLLEEINEFGYRKTGKKYEVSDNTIRKWVKFYEKKY